MLTAHQRQRHRADTEPMPADAATEVGADDGLGPARGLCIGTLFAIALWLVMVLAAIAVFA